MEHYVLAIMDNPIIFEKAQIEWRKYNIGVNNAKDVPSALREMQNQQYAMLTMIADYLQMELLDAIRLTRSISSIPILVLTSTYRPEEQLAGIKLGADQYISLPETTEEYVVAGLALVRRHLHMYKDIPPSLQMIEHSGLLLSVDHFKVFVYGDEVTMTPKEYKILQLLMENRHRTLTYNQIYRNIWGEEYVGDSQRTINNIVSKLKKKI